MIKKFIVWYLKKHNCMFEYKDYTVRMFSSGYYGRIKQYEEMISDVNCRHCWYPIFDNEITKK